MHDTTGKLLDDRAERERAPVRRHSQLAGRCEGLFWRRTDKHHVRQIVTAARRYELAGRQPGARNGPLGHVALEVLDLLANMVNPRTGRLDPSLQTLMCRLKRSKDAIVRALRALRTHGFLDWLRRYVPTGAEGRGPRVQQTSNAYRLSMPARAMRLLGRMGKPPPPPDDHSHAQEQRRAELDAYRATLDLEQRTLFDVADPGLAESLARMARNIMAKRESGRRSES